LESDGLGCVIVLNQLLQRYLSESEQAIEASVAYLASSDALRAIAREPYWPKWDSPWWHMVLLHELGLNKRIPVVAAQSMAVALRTHYLPTFPFCEADVPEGIDPHRQTLCHCALGGMVQVLAGTGIVVDEAVPYWREWFLRYQLPDGGLNCDNEAYLRPIPRSSMVSTLPALEAVLTLTARPFTSQETAFLDAGAEYLLARCLCRSLSKGGYIDAAWLTPSFPRFYEYDVLRGLRFLGLWAQRLARPIPAVAIQEAYCAMEDFFADDTAMPRVWVTHNRTLPATGHGPPEPASDFELLSVTAGSVLAREVLLQEWRTTRAFLDKAVAPR